MSQSRRNFRTVIVAGLMVLFANHLGRAQKAPSNDGARHRETIPELDDHVLQSMESWAALVHRRIFEPLEMSRSAATLNELRQQTGVAFRDYRGDLRLSHLGSTPGWSAAVALLPARGLGVAVFTNITRGTALVDSRQRWVLDRLLGAERRDWAGEALERELRRRTEARAALAEAAEVRAGGTEPSRALDAYVGTYVDSLYPPARVTLRDGGLRLTLGPQLSGELDHWERDTFRVTWDRVEFGANLVTFHVTPDSIPGRLGTRMLGRGAEWRRSGDSPDEGRP